MRVVTFTGRTGALTRDLWGEMRTDFVKSTIPARLFHYTKDEYVMGMDDEERMRQAAPPTHMPRPNTHACRRCWR
jgi:hypothetical protein